MKKSVLFLSFILLTIMFAISAEADILYPPSVHPYLYVNEQFINDVKANKTGNIYGKDYAAVKAYSERTLPEIVEGEQSVIKSSVSNIIECKAFMYLMGEISKEEIADTIDYTIKYLEDPTTTAALGSTTYYNNLGNYGVRCGALVYDWCYDAMTPEQKELLCETIHALMYNKNAKFPPNAKNSWGNVAGGMVGSPIVFNSLGSAAIYNENPEAYEDCMPEIQSIMIEGGNYFSSKGALCDASIAYIREHIFLQLKALFDRMGHEGLFEDYSKVGYKLIYSRLPYGAFIKIGDDYANSNYNNFGTVTNSNETAKVMGMLSANTENPYFRYQYLRENYNSTSLDNLLFKSGDIEVKMPDDLPLSYFIDEPRSEIISRTSWLEGLDSPAVLGYMNMHNRRSGDHDHAVAGSFQLYYKGPLTISGGVYNGSDWGDSHWANYLTRSVSANCVTVYDPDEVFAYGYKIAEANDGGQKMVKSSVGGGYVVKDLNEYLSDAFYAASTKAHYIGPNESTPAFSYIKGDLTNAYSSNKMESYKRSMVFMDTFNETYPGVMIVFDRVVSKKAEFQKKWLLQAVTKPQISGNKITIVNDIDGCNGKLVNYTLLPQQISKTQVVGDTGVYMVDGKEYPAPSNTANYAYQGGIRCEIMPKENNTEDLFLNAMYVSDADSSAEDLQMIYEDTDIFAGVTTLDRMVMFSKTGEEVEGSFKIFVRNNGYGKVLCLINDLKAGKWKVEGNGESYILEAAEESGCAMFKASAGVEYTFTKASAGDKVTNQSFSQTPKRKTGDYAIKYDGKYINLPYETKLVNDEAYIPVESLEKFGVCVSETANGYELKKGINRAIIENGADSYLYNGEEIAFSNSAYTENGEMYIPAKDLSEIIMAEITYVPKTILLSVNSHKSFEVNNIILPKNAENIGRLTKLFDGVNGGKVDFSATESIVYDLNGLKTVNQIVLSGGNLNTCQMYYSLDGINYSTISKENYEIKNNAAYIEVDKTMQFFKLEILKDTSFSEVSLCGEDYSGKVCLFDDGIKNYVIDSPVKISAYLEPGFTEAGIYIGGTLVYTPESGGIIECTADISNFEKYKNYTLRLAATYNGEEKEIIKEVYFTDAAKEIIVAEKRYDSAASGTISNKTHASAQINDGELQINLDARFESNAPYITLNTDKLHGRYETSFKIRSTSPYCKLTYEVVDYYGSYAASGAANTILANFNEGEYFVTIKLDTINSVLEAYSGDTLIFRKRYCTDGVGHMRLTLTNSGEAATVFIDDIVIKYKEIKTFNKFFKAEFAVRNGVLGAVINSDENCGVGRRKCIKVIKKGGKLERVDIVSFDGTIDKFIPFEVPETFFEDEGYDAEIYILPNHKKQKTYNPLEVDGFAKFRNN